MNRSSVNYRDKRNYKIALESVLIALLNRHFEIVLRKPKSKSTTTLSYIEIESIKRNNDSLQINTFVEERIKTLIEDQIKKGYKYSTIMSKSRRMKIEETNSLLVDLLTEEGYLFITKTIMKGTVIVDKIKYLESFSISYNDIILIGKQINEWIISKLINEQSILLILNNKMLSIFLKKYFNQE
ncbi:hypothetical protein EHI8A_045680 [Entamoeba histolytica HM-1:IMSS-B]|uniref:Zinc finger protein putative n=2 Tax=Entamoeba histolytica TaxID=5759 RepID=A0A175JJK1_ENTHI|nr:hypothetical protein EHI8A_045680 [Entamoeba histolytica HM-1:IMSS-B]GAT93871.1 zinc finger protein putative [Entamoeba histolytica]